MTEYLVYLAGPITGCTYDGCVEWRKTLRDSMPSYIHTYSPMRGKQRLKEISNGSVIKDSYEDNQLTSVKGINTRDYNDVRRADVVFVNMLGAEKVSIGTVMEIAWARAFSKPVICVMEKDNIHNHSMLNYACGYIVNTLEEGISILNVLLSSDQQLLAQEAKPAKNVVTINEKRIETSYTELTYGQVVLSAGKNPEVNYSVTYSKGRNRGGGILSPGGVVEVTDGMNFSVMLTNKA